MKDRWCRVVYFTVVLCCVADFAYPQGKPEDSIYNVRRFGAAGDGRTDDTAAVQEALTSAGEAGGGTVLLPRGTYLIEGHLDVPSYVTLRGIWEIPTAWTEMKGTTLLAVEGEGSTDGHPFILLRPNATLRGVTVFYPNQSASSPEPYPWCIGGVLDNPSIIDCLLVNPYLGVNFGTEYSPSGQGVGRHYIRNLYGHPLRKGLFIDDCRDIGRIENVHFWPFWGGDEFTRENGEAFIFGRADWQYALNTFCYGYKVGYRFIPGNSGSATNGNFQGIGADGTEHAIHVDQASPLGLLITNGEFSSFYGDNRVEIYTGPEFTGTIQFQNCGFWGSNRNIGYLEGAGTVSFMNCNFVRWSYQEAPSPAIDCFGGELSVIGCRFRAAAPQLRLHENVKQAIFSQNLCRGYRSIVDNSQGGTLIESNIFGTFPAEEKGAIVIDNAMIKGAHREGYFEGGIGWSTYAGGRSYLASTAWAAAGTGELRASWRPLFRKPGDYEVFAWFGVEKETLKNATNARFRIHHRAGGFGNKRAVSAVVVDTTAKTQQWVSLGVYRFGSGAQHFVEVDNEANGRVLADAVKFVPR